MPQPPAGFLVRHRTFLTAIAAVLVALGLADLLYLVAGDAYVARALASGHRATLQVIIATWVPESLEAYHAAAARLVAWFNIIVLCLLALLIPGEFCQGWLGRLYGLVTRGCDRAVRHRWIAVTALAAIALAIAAWMAVAVFQRFPNSGDEYCYLYQADTWRAGRAWNPQHPLQPFFEFDHVRVLNGRVFSVFPPGWPAVLLGMGLLGVPAWMVNPLLGALVVPVLFLLGRRWYGERVALLASATLVASQFFLFNNASYYAHTFTLLATLVMVHAALEGMEQVSFAWAALAGFAFGGAFAARFFTAIMAGLPLGILFLWRYRRAWPFALGFLAGAAPWLAFFLWHNHAVMGTWFTLPMNGFEAYDRRWFAPDLLTRGSKLAALNLLQFMLWVPAVLLPIYAVALARRPVDPRRLAQGAVFACLVAGYFFYVDDGGNRYGPRYYFEGLPFLILPAVALLFEQREWSAMDSAGRWRFHLFAVSLLVSLPVCASHAIRVHDTIWERRDLYRLVERASLANAAVFVSTPSGTIARMDPLALTRNGIDDRGSVLYLLDRGADNVRAFDGYPDRSFYRYRYDVRARQGTLEPVVRPR